MLGFGAIGEHAIGESPGVLEPALTKGSKQATLVVSGILIPEGKTHEGILVHSASSVWFELIRALSDDWSLARTIPPAQWEEIVAAAFKRQGFDEVTLTPRSGDHGRDVIAVRRGVGCIKIIDSVKAYAPDHLVRHDDVRALLGVMSGERDVSKAIITTTSDFAPKIATDPFIAPFLPTRLELMNGQALLAWLRELQRQT